MMLSSFLPPFVLTVFLSPGITQAQVNSHNTCLLGPTVAVGASLHICDDPDAILQDSVSATVLSIPPEYLFEISDGSESPSSVLPATQMTLRYAAATYRHFSSPILPSHSFCS